MSKLSDNLSLGQPGSHHNATSPLGIVISGDEIVTGCELEPFFHSLCLPAAAAATMRTFPARSSRTYPAPQHFRRTDYPRQRSPPPFVSQFAVLTFSPSGNIVPPFDPKLDLHGTSFLREGGSRPNPALTFSDCDVSNAKDSPIRPLTFPEDLALSSRT